MVLSDIVFGEKEVRIYETDNRVSVNGVTINDKFHYPRGGAVYNNKIYISDSYNHVIKIFNEELVKIGEYGKGILAEPSGIEIIKDNIYVCDTDNGKIQIFSLTGEYIGLFAEKLKKPIIIKEKNGKVYVNDINGNSVLIYDLNGILLKCIKAKLKYPAGVALSEKYLYVASQFSKEILRYTLDGIYIDQYSEGKYFSKIQTIKDKIFYFDEENGTTGELELKEEEFSLERYIGQQGYIKEKGYYVYSIDKKAGLKLFHNIELWDKEMEEENAIIADELGGIQGYKFMAEYSKNKKYYSELLNEQEYYIEPEKEITSLGEDKLEKPKGIAIDGEYKWISLFNKKIVAKIDNNNVMEAFFTSDIQTEKIVAQNGRVWLIDYFYKRVFELNQDNGEMEIFIENLESPVDIKAKENKIVILDSVLKKLLSYNFKGKIIESFGIEGEEPVAFDINQKYYLLDKKSGRIYIYSIDGKMEKTIENNFGLRYPEGIAVDDDGYIYITDEGNNRFIKIDSDGKFIYEMRGLTMPKDIIYTNGKVYISNYGADNIKIYKVR